MSDTYTPISGGLVVIFEGLDGVGKTTQLKLAQDDLEERGYRVHPTRNLGGSPIGEELRSVMLSSLARPPAVNLYLSVAIQEALGQVINEERNKGSIILLDRGPMSLVAYQSYGDKLDKTTCWRFAEEGITKLKPEQIILYNMDIEAALVRARERNQSAKADYYESKPLSYFEDVLEGLLKGADKYAASTIDASQTIEAVHDQTMALIDKLLESKLNA